MPDQGNVPGQQGHQPLEINQPGEGDQLGVPRPTQVVDMTAQKVRSNFPEPFRVIQEAEVCLQLCLAEVMPIAQRSVLAQVLQQNEQLPVRRAVRVVSLAHDRQFDVPGLGMGQQFFQGRPRSI